MPEKIVKKVLIFDHGTASTENLKHMYEQHAKQWKKNNPNLPEVEYAIDIKKESDLLKIRERNPDYLQSIDIVHRSGSMKKNLSSEASEWIDKGLRSDAYDVGTCYGAQQHAKGQDLNLIKLKEHRKGKQAINYAGWNSSGQPETRYIHMNHSYGIPVSEDSKSKLEAIATSNQQFKNGTKGQIYEVFRVKGTNKIGIQGHGEQGIGKDIMYDTLNMIQNEMYNKNKKVYRMAEYNEMLQKNKSKNEKVYRMAA